MNFSTVGQTYFHRTNDTKRNNVAGVARKERATTLGIRSFAGVRENSHAARRRGDRAASIFLTRHYRRRYVVTIRWLARGTHLVVK